MSPCSGLKRAVKRDQTWRRWNTHTHTHRMNRMSWYTEAAYLIDRLCFTLIIRRYKTWRERQKRFHVWLEMKKCGPKISDSSCLWVNHFSGFCMNMWSVALLQWNSRRYLWSSSQHEICLLLILCHAQLCHAQDLRSNYYYIIFFGCTWNKIISI